MRTNNWMRHLAWGVLGLLSHESFSQATQANNAGGFGSFLGWNAGAGQILEVKNEANEPIDMYTDNIRRFRLHNSSSYFALGSFPFIPAPGYALLSPNVDQFFTNGAPGPYSLLHLAGANNNAQQQSYRPWMQTGITMTGNDDHNYFGQKASSLDFTDVVLHWSDNPGKFLKDRMRFIFTSSFSGAASGSGSLEGLEGMRLFPVDDNSIHIGMGDFYAANLADPSITEPTERLDIVDGRVRIRELPEASGEATGTYKVMVVDDAATPNGERGVVKWVDPLDLPPTGGTGGGDCDWVINTSANRLTTAFQPVNSNGNCPEIDWNVGVGINNPTAKLHVIKSIASSGGNHAGWFDMQGAAGNNTGIRAMASGTPGFENYGVQARSYNASSKNFGLHGWGILDGNGTTSENHGVYGSGQVGVNATCTTNYGVRAYGLANGTTTSNYGIHAVANGPGAGTHYGIWAQAPGSPHWAGFFAGDVTVTGLGFIPGGVWQPSDETLKSNIEPLENAREVLSQLEAKTYEFMVDAHPNAGLPSGFQGGLMSQQLQVVLPHLVKDVTIPEMLDDEGNVLYPSETLKAMNYGGLIP